MERPEPPAMTGEACIPNIGAKGRDRRLKHGIAWLVVGMVASVAFILLRPPLPAFGGLYVVFFMAALGYFQASQKT